MVTEVTSLTEEKMRVEVMSNMMFLERILRVGAGGDVNVVNVDSRGINKRLICTHENYKSR